MADKKQDQFAEINKKVKDQVAECFNLIWGKHIAHFGLADIPIGDGASASGEEIFITEKNDEQKTVFMLQPSYADKGTSFVNHNKKLLSEAIGIYLDFYNKSLKRSKTWRSQKAFEGAKGDYILKGESLKLKDKVEFENPEDEKTALAKASEIEKLFEIINNYQLNRIAEYANEKAAAELTKFKQELDGIKIENFENPIPVKIIGEENKDGEQEVPKEVEKDAGDALKSTMAMPQHVADEDYDKKLEATKKQIEEGRKALEDWMKNDEEAANIIMKAIKPIEKYKQQMLPQVWLFAHVNKLKAMFESLLEYNEMYNLLLEAGEGDSSEQPSGAEPSGNGAPENDAAAKGNDDQANKEKEEWKKKAGELLKGIDEILKKEKPSDFASAYESWGKAVTELFNNMAANDKLKEKLAEIKDEDPYVKLCTVGHIVTAKEGEGDMDPKEAEAKIKDALKGKNPDDLTDEEKGAMLAGLQGQGVPEDIIKKTLNMAEAFTNKNFLTTLRSFLKESAKRV